jgi:acyl carrier protein
MSTKTLFDDAYITALADPKHRKVAKKIDELTRVFGFTSFTHLYLEDELHKALNFDSLDLIEIIMALEDEFDIEIDENQPCPEKDYPITDKQATVADLLHLAISLVKA